MLPSSVQASWLSEALHQRDDARRIGVVVPVSAYPAPGNVYTPRYTPPAYPGYSAPARPAPYRVDPAAPLIERLAEGLQTLREDVGVEVPGPQGRALAALADDLEDQAEHLRMDLRDGDPAEHLYKHAVEIDRGLHEFLEATEALGEGGEFLNRAALRLERQDHYLMRLLSPAGSPEIGD